MGAFEVLTPPNPEYRRLVNSIGIPVLLVIGDVSAGAIVSPEVAREMQILNSRVRIEQVQGAGHGLPYDQPERVGAIARSFLETMVLS